MAHPEYRKKYLFIDDSSVVQSDNLRRVTNQAVKHPGPVMVPDAPWDTKDIYLNGCDPRYDPQSGFPRCPLAADPLLAVQYDAASVSSAQRRSCRTVVHQALLHTSQPGR